MGAFSHKVIRIMRIVTGCLCLFAAMSLTTLVSASEWNPSCGFFSNWKDWRTLPWERGDCHEQQPFEIDPCGGLTYMPHPGGETFAGYGATALHERTQCTFERIRERGGALAVLIRSKSTPYPYDNNEPFDGAPDTVANILETVPDLDYLLMALEGESKYVKPNIRRIGRLVRQSSANPYMGNYNWYAADVNTTAGHVDRSDRRAKSRAYLNSDLNVAMPSCYAYDNAGRVHIRPNAFGGASPNEESAMFWVPLERMSNAARNLPTGHRIIPWVSPYVCKWPCDGPPPELDTLAALIQHFRMRGADGLMLYPGGWAGQTPTISSADYETLVLDAWHELDPYISLRDEPEFLNLETVKVTGVEWSGIATKSYVVVLTSNLGNDGRVIINLPDIDGAPPTVAARPGHKLHVWPKQSMTGDINGDGAVSVIDLLLVINNYTMTCSNCPHDVNDNGVVDYADLLLVLENWTA